MNIYKTKEKKSQLYATDKELPGVISFLLTELTDLKLYQFAFLQTKKRKYKEKNFRYLQS